MRARSGTLSSGLWYVTTACSLSLSFRESTITLEPSFPTHLLFEEIFFGGKRENYTHHRKLHRQLLIPLLASPGAYHVREGYQIF